MSSPDEKMVQETAYAKVNLTLEVLGRRQDGYHEIRSILQTISLADHLTFRQADGLHLDCTVPGLEGTSNLVMRAAHLMQTAIGRQPGAHIELRKEVPVAAGLGGGSSDAAATLRGLNRLWNLDLPFERLSTMGAALGSDVPFLLRGGTALVRGRGEAVVPLAPAPSTWLVLLVPPLWLENKTAYLYSLLDADCYTSGEATRRLSEELGKNRLPAGLLCNAFERVMHGAFSGISRFAAALVDAGARKVNLAGSGPTLYTTAQDEKDAEEIAQKLKPFSHRVFVVKTVAVVP